LPLEARKPGQSEPLPPLAHDLPRRVETGSDKVIRKAISCQEDDSGADNVTIR